MAAKPINLNPNRDSQPAAATPVPSTLPGKSSASPWANSVIAAVAIGAALYFARVVFIVVAFSLLLAFVLEPCTRFLERMRLPRSMGALISVLLFCGALFAIGNVSYNKAIDFTHELPKYSREIRKYVGKYRRQAQTLQQSTQQVLPDDNDGPTIKVKQESSWTDKLFNSLGTATELTFSISFIPFLAYFMLSWKEHMRAGTVLLFQPENRSTAYATLGAMAGMIRGFVIGNLLIGLMIGGISTAVFALMGLPYFYFIGFISGFLSLVPYLGVVLAAVPPLLAGVGEINGTGVFIVLGTVLGVHLFALNVLYPKVLGSRLQLNPLAVTVALLFWGWIWGALGLVLAIPMTAGLKIVCDHIDSLQTVGELLGE